METDGHCFPAISFLSAMQRRKISAHHVAFWRWDEAKGERAAFDSKRRLTLRDDTPPASLAL
jgi:hypothetical protein